MALDYSRLRSLTAREITVSFHRAGETFELKTLRSMLELQARWGGNDLFRLRLI